MASDTQRALGSVTSGTQRLDSWARCGLWLARSQGSTETRSSNLSTDAGPGASGKNVHMCRDTPLPTPGGSFLELSGG